MGILCSNNEKINRKTKKQKDKKQKSMYRYNKIVGNREKKDLFDTSFFLFIFLTSSSTLRVILQA